MGAFLLLFSTLAFASSDFHWVEFTPLVKVGAEGDAAPTSLDAGNTCLTVHLGVQVIEGKVAKARLEESPGWTLSSHVDLTNEEIEGIELIQDSSGRYWVSRLPLNRRLLLWTLRSRCGLQTPFWGQFKSIEDTIAPYVFQTSGLGEEALIALSQMESFRGRWSDQKETPFRAWMSVRQGKSIQEAK